MKTTMAAVMAILMLAAGASGATTKKTTTKSKPAAKKSTAKAPDRSKLLDPSELTARAPDVFNVRFETSKGPFVVEVHRTWAPNGADRFYNLVTNGYYDDVRFFRVIADFMAQFGISGDPKLNRVWENADIPDDAVTQSNTRGMISFATRGPNSRSNQLFINYSDGNARLDSMGFSPFGKVIEGMTVVDALYSRYGEGAPGGGGPDQGRLQAEGNEYLKKEFPQLDFIQTARVVGK